jgi:hypothetical protein
MSHLYCTLQAVDSMEAPKRIRLRPDADKKSVVWLDPLDLDSVSRHHSVSGNGIYECYLEHICFIGGFQLTSNARQVQVYLTPDAISSPEAYLTTVKGLSSSEQQWCKAQCVIPGGP